MLLFQVPIVSGGPTDPPSGDLVTQHQPRDKDFSSPSDSSEFQLFSLSSCVALAKVQNNNISSYY